MSVLAESARREADQPGSGRRTSAWRWALPAICLIAAGNFLWQLGSSSYYVDELTSLASALTRFGNLLHAVGRFEISPPAYYVFLHEWLFRLGAGSEWLRRLAVGHEWLARLPSAICGVMLVAAVYWLCSLVTERRATRLGAAALTALSPFVLQYSQQAEPYVFAALATTLAVAAAIRATRGDGAGDRWLALSLVASVLAVCLHYTAAIVIAPLCVWIAASPELGRRWRAAFPLGCLATALALLPLVITQHHSFPTRIGVSSSGAVTWTTVRRMLEVPFTGRVDALPWLGVVVSLAAAAALLLNWFWRGAGSRPRQIGRPGPRAGVLLLAAGVPVCLFAFSAIVGSGFLGHLMLPRYAAAGAPFMIVAVALATETVPRPAALALAACAAIAAVAGLAENHRTSGFYLDARGAVRYLRQHARPGQLVVAPGDTVASVPLTAYGLSADYTGSEGLVAVLAARHRPVWLVVELATGSSTAPRTVLAFENAFLRRFRERALTARVLPGVPPLAIVLIAPESRAGPYHHR